ncbi:MAG: hemerythrin domain-containing protein [Rhodocyclales bacterium]|nr:hemerythrin domain-containing protein [Rhodocyclales bacterium]
MLNSALSIIYDEHRSLAAVVQGLRYLVGEYSRRRLAPDFGLLRAIVAYLDEFPQRLHHPKEEAFLFERLQLRTRTADAIIAELKRQHVHDASLVAALRLALERFESGQDGGLAEFGKAVADYSEGILPHMALEEASLLPLACRHLSGEDWVEIGVAFGANGDPRFTANANSEFADLFRRIFDLAAPGGSGSAGTS